MGGTLDCVPVHMFLNFWEKPKKIFDIEHMAKIDFLNSTYATR
jgi:hypothetical protein